MVQRIIDIMLVSGIHFVKQPAYTEVCVGGTAFFSCSYSGILTRPLWKINSTIYSSSSLPDNHVYNGEVLRISHVNVSEVNTTYQCFFQMLSNPKNPNCSAISSKVGTLNVLSKGKLS